MSGTRRSPPKLAWSRVPLWAIVVLAAATVVGSFGPLLEGTAAASAPIAGTPSSPSASNGATSFAARAGYSPTLPAGVDAIGPASGTLPVSVTFEQPLSPSAYDAAIAYFRSEGLTVTSTVADRISVGLSGTATAVGQAFATDLESGSYGGSSVTFPATPPSLPPSLQPEVAGVVGLASGFTRFSFDLQPVAGAAPTAAGEVSPEDANTVTPGLAREFYDLSELYNLSGGAKYPTNLSIAVVLWGEGYAPSDLASFFSEDYPSSFPTASYRAVTVDGADPPSASALSSPDLDAVKELTLDIEWSESMAPGATIDAVYVPDGPADDGYSPSAAQLTDALSTAISLNVSVISLSFGADEGGSGTLISSWTPLLQEAANRNITVLAATGDTGGDTNQTNGCSDVAAPNYPSSSPMVVAVGGTNVSIQTTLGLGVTGFTETGWSGSGGGFSQRFSAPAWQEVGSAAGPIRASGYRGMPDVSATAADNFLYFDGGPGVAAGTSFATPLWAGIIADIDAKWGHDLGFFTPNLYNVGAHEPGGAIGDGVVDVTGGSNCVGTATTGWDVVTGWGSPRAAILYDDLLGSFVNIALYVDQGTVAPGGTVTVTAQLTNRTSGAPIANVSVDLALQSDTDLGPCTGTFGSASPPTNSDGWVAASFSVPLCYLGPHANLLASVTTTKLYGTTSLRVDVNLLGLAPGLQALEQAPWAYVTYAGIVGAACVAGVWLGRERRPPRVARRPVVHPSPPASGAGTGTAPPPSTSGPPTPSPPPPPGTTGTPPGGSAGGRPPPEAAPPSGATTSATAPAVPSSTSPVPPAPASAGPTSAPTAPAPPRPPTTRPGSPSSVAGDPPA